MKRSKVKYYFLILILLIPALISVAQEVNIKGMAVGSSTLGYSSEWAFQLGARYIPALEFMLPVKGNMTIEGEFSANLAASYTNPAPGDKFYGKIKPYRMWVKLSGDQFEVRAGLQKINFGSATILRPLMWFDRIDPRDPLQLTDGAYGILGRYYTLNNINLWGWALYGNNSTKGWEVFETKKGNIELGGRLQLPLPRAELGLTYHNRKGILPAIVSGYSEDQQFSENRFGLDFKADIVIGFWVEDVVEYQSHEWDYPYSNKLTVGADYTFGLGSGLNLMSEHFIYHSSNSLFGNDQSVQFTSMSLNYPVSITANLSAIVYYDWSNKEIYRFLNFGLTYDRFSYYAMGFWNPERFNIFDFNSGPNLFNGIGFQLMMVYNH